MRKRLEENEENGFFNPNKTEDDEYEVEELLPEVIESNEEIFKE